MCWRISGRIRDVSVAVSHQLNILKANGIVKSQRQGKYIYYIVQDEYVQNAIERCKMMFDKEYCL